MSSRDLTLAMKLYADASRWVSGLANGDTATRKFVGGAKREFESLKNSLSSVEGKLASIGITVGATAQIIASARLDKSLTQIGQTAGEDSRQISKLRQELFRMSKETGQPVDDLKNGINNAVQAGLRFDEALPVMDAVNKAMAVTGASADVLTSGLTVASTAYNFDLKKPGMALQLLDQMTVAGRLGNAELENLSGIFARIGPNASAAGLGFGQTLSLIEGLSKIERQPERLATLADSTLRLFNNVNYMKDAQKVTGVKFFDADGSRRDAFAVFSDIKKQYDKLTTETARNDFMHRAFGKADLDLKKGMQIISTGKMLSDISGKFTSEIANAGSTLKRDLPGALNNAVDQTGRLKASLREAADGFAKPINTVLQNSIKKVLDSKAQGGLGWDGTDILTAAGVAGAGTLLTARYGGKAIKGLAGKFGNIGTGVATGKALETAAGVTPVYVVNMSEGGMGVPGLPTTLAGKGGWLKSLGLGAFGTTAAVGTASLAGGYAIGNTDIGGKIALAIMDAFGSKDARMALNTMKNENNLNGTIKIQLDQTGKFMSAKSNMSQPGVKVNMANGPYMASAD